MCIRDRSTENRVQVINEYTNNVIKMDMGKELLEEEELWAVVERYRAVSYTHLDVYKRQVYNRCLVLIMYNKCCLLFFL